MNKFRIFSYDEELFNALNAIEYKRTSAGNFVFEKRQDMHDDLAYALALAWFAANQDGVKGVVMKV